MEARKCCGANLKSSSAWALEKTDTGKLLAKVG